MIGIPPLFGLCKGSEKVKWGINSRTDESDQESEVFPIYSTYLKTSV